MTEVDHSLLQSGTSSNLQDKCSLEGSSHSNSLIRTAVVVKVGFLVLMNVEQKILDVIIVEEGVIILKHAIGVSKT